VQAQEAAVGINIVIDSLDGGAVPAQLEAGNFDVFLGSSTGDIDPDTLISQRNATSGSVNQSGYSNPRLHLILDNGRKALSEKARRTLYHAAETIIANDRPAIYLYHPVRFSAFNADLTGVRLRPDGFLRVAFAQYK